MTDRSNVLRMPVTAPRGTVYLTGLQWSLWWTLTRPRRTWTHGDLTLTKLSALTGSSRGRCWHAIARLRSLELIGFRAWPAMPVRDERPRRFSPGCRGRLLVWVPTRARAARFAALGSGRPRAIDSVSGSYRAHPLAYASATGAGRSWENRQPPRPGRSGGRTGPRRGPPRLVYGRCPAGHTVPLARLSLEAGPSWAPSLTASYVGPCRRCGAVVRDGFAVVLPPPPGRGPTADELASPALVAARLEAARAFIGTAPAPAIREALRRDYLERTPGAPPWTGDAPEPAGRILERAIPRRRPTTIP